MNISTVELTAKVATLRAIASSLPSHKISFANSLTGQHKAKGYLSHIQVPYVDELIALAQGTATPSSNLRETTEVGGFASVVALFNTAASKLKYPKITLRLFGAPVLDNPYDSTPVWYDVRLQVAGSRSSRPGWVNVTSADAFGDRDFYGRVSPAGAFEHGRDAKVLPDGLLIPFLQKLASNPVATVVEFGALTGHCCFCNLPLSDSQSKAAGFGATCAKNYGLTTEYKSASKLSV